MDEMERIETRLNDHAERIRILEIGNATQNEKIDSLCGAIGKLAARIDYLVEFLKTCMWKAMGIGSTLFMVFLGFFIWYVQTL